MDIADRLPTQLHHAYFLIVAERQEGIAQCTNVVADRLGLSVRGNPDFIVRSYDRMAIDHAHELKSLVSVTPLTVRACIISVGVILPDAQQALLKLFEDPPVRTHFFVVSESDSYVLPTLASRFETYQIAKDSVLDGVQAFCSLPRIEQLSYVEHVAEEGTEATRRFLRALEQLLAKDVVRYRVVLAHIVDAQKFLLLPSANRKHILETITLAL